MLRDMRKLFAFFACAVALVPALKAQTVISAGRAIEIQIKGVPQEEMVLINGTYPVSEAGSIRLPLLSSPIRAAGLSPDVLGRNIEAAYRAAKIYTRPNVQVLASNNETVTKHFVTIGGHVRRNGPVDYTHGMTIYQAVQAGGGASEFGAMNRVTLQRGGKVRIYDLEKPQFRNVPVEPNDMIEVPQKNVWGR